MSSRQPRSAVQDAARPVCVDLDGTLISGDLLWESFILLVKQHPLEALTALLGILKGRAHFKRLVATAIDIDVAELPYRADLVSHLQGIRESGTFVVLATASDDKYATQVAAHLALFDEVHASNGVRNLSGHTKAAHLVKRFGERGFDYIGNDWSDLPVWRASGGSIAIAPTARLTRHLTQHDLVSRIWGHRGSQLRAMARALRPHQWVKNLLVFVPFLAAHEAPRLDLWMASALTFVAFSLCASAVYIINDIFDITSDRRHPRKRMRPFAAGDISIPVGCALSLGLLAASGLIAAAGVSWPLAGVLLAYFGMTFLYSLFLKSRPVVDVFMLTALYVVRIVAGGVATGTPLSSWLLAFGLFSFLSLAFVKRYIELVAVNAWLPGRGYGPSDTMWIHAVGTNAGYMAVLVLALYVNSPEVSVLYSRSKALWFLCPILLFWFTRLWFKAGRKQVHDDPVAEAVKDPFSYVAAVAVLGILFLAI